MASADLLTPCRLILFLIGNFLSVKHSFITLGNFINSDLDTTLKNINSNSSSVDYSLNKFDDVLENINNKVDELTQNTSNIFLVNDIKYGPGEMK